MARYMLHIFEIFPGHREPILRERRAFAARDEPAAIAEANQRYDNFATDLAQLDPAVVLDGFVLYDGSRVVYERPRRPP
jgi:hypothetical protein